MTASMNRSGVPWADYAWNPIEGCSPASEGCERCYAAALARRFHRPWGAPVFHEDRLEQPFHTRKPGRVFVCSTSDLFHDGLTAVQINRVFEVMAADTRHTFMVLTKRIERAAGILPGLSWNFGAAHANGLTYRFDARWPLPNVWLGVTAENQARAEERIPWLLRVPAAVRFVSVEPMLEWVDLRAVKFPTGVVENVLHTEVSGRFKSIVGRLHGIDWVIAGPENGPGKRPFHSAWIDFEYDGMGLTEQCRRASVPFFDKRQPGSEGYTRREWPEARPS